MPIFDDKAYRQGKLIAQDMMRGTYDSANDYCQKKDGPPGWVIGLGMVVLLAVSVFHIWAVL